MSDQQIFDTVKTIIIQTLEAEERTPGVIAPDTALNETGLDSLEWAVVVVQLEDLLNIDPFEMGIEGVLLTVGDLASLYVRGLSQNKAA